MLHICSICVSQWSPSASVHSGRTPQSPHRVLSADRPRGVRGYMLGSFDRNRSRSRPTSLLHRGSALSKTARFGDRRHRRDRCRSTSSRPKVAAKIAALTNSLILVHGPPAEPLIRCTKRNNARDMTTLAGMQGNAWAGAIRPPAFAHPALLSAGAGPPSLARKLRWQNYVWGNIAQCDKLEIRKVLERTEIDDQRTVRNDNTSHSRQAA